MKPSQLALLLIATALLTGCQQRPKLTTEEQAKLTLEKRNKEIMDRTVSGGPPPGQKSVLGADLKREFEKRGAKLSFQGNVPAVKTP
jgi:hypothetical protein